MLWGVIKGFGFGVSRLSLLLGLWLRHRPTPFGFQIKICNSSQGEASRKHLCFLFVSRRNGREASTIFLLGNLGCVSRETFINNIPYSNKIFFYISIFNSMKFYRSLLPYLIVLLMAVASFADESKEEEKMRDDTYESGFALIPWSAFIGGGDAFIAGVDWVFGNYSFLYDSFLDDSSSELNGSSRHLWVWSLRSQVLWTSSYGFYLQPTMQYLYVGIPLLGLFKVSVGPEIGYKINTGFEYGGSVRVGTFIDILNLEIGYLVKSERTYMNIIINIPSGFRIWT